MQAELSHADGHGERKAALEMIDRHSSVSTRRLTLGADKDMTVNMVLQPDGLPRVMIDPVSLR